MDDFQRAVVRKYAPRGNSTQYLMVLHCEHSVLWPSPARMQLPRHTPKSVACWRCEAGWTGKYGRRRKAAPETPDA